LQRKEIIIARGGAAAPQKIKCVIFAQVLKLCRREPYLLFKNAKSRKEQ
jgi:hypothetical protein